MPIFREEINTGTFDDDGTGDPLRTFAAKSNRNFKQLFETHVTAEAEGFTAAEYARNQGDRAGVQGTRAQAAADAGVAIAGWRDQAQTAAVTAQVFVNGVLYANTASGLAAVAANGYFAVVGDNISTASIIYQKVNGAAVEVTRVPGGYAVAAALSRTSKIFNVADAQYAGGAKGDGVTNDSAAFKMANAMCALNGGGTVFVPFTGNPYILADDEFVFGSFTLADNSTVPFKRGIIKMLPGVSWASDGAEVKMSGGRSYPGGIFYHPWWDLTVLRDISFFGLVLNGNMPAQVKAIYPANTNDGRIWQHGHGVTFGQWERVSFTSCEFFGFVGNGISMFDNYGAKVNTNNLAPTVSNTLTVDSCSFHDLFGIGVGIGVSRNCEVKYCRFYGDGFWVGAITPEVLTPDGLLIDHWYHHNTFDFRGGRLPPESYPQYASNSQQAEDARKHLRRAVCGIVYTGYPNNQYNESLRGLVFESNLIYQGTFQAYNYGYVEVLNNKFYNFYEDMNGTYISGTDCIIIALGDTKNVRGGRVVGNTIESDLVGYGVFIHGSEDIFVADNTVKACRKGGLRLEVTSGIVTNNRLVSVGGPATAAQLQADPATSSAIQIFGCGDTPLDIIENVCVDKRPSGSKGTQHMVHANFPASPRCSITGNQAHGILGKVVNDTGNAAFHYGNAQDGDRTFRTNISMAAPLGQFDVLAGAIGPHRFTGDVQLGDQVNGGGNAMVQYFINKKFRYQMGAVADGTFLFQAFAESGAYLGSPWYITPNGRLNHPQDWMSPIIYGSNLRLWADYSTGVLRTKSGADPTGQDDGDMLALVVNAAPASANAAGKRGQFFVDENWRYDCIAPNNWRRSPVATW
jgi:hypothetical protein